ncbi:MAG: ATP12 family protein [Paracoccaceae bacterium]
MDARKMRRFWDSVSVSNIGAGYGISLDSRQVHTPLKEPLILPTRALADAVAAEWLAQGDYVDPGAMPFTRTANSAIDKVLPQKQDVADMLLGYGDCDLLCYRADSPEALVDRQKAAWDPILDWAEQELDARLQLRTGVVHIPQSVAEIERLSAHTQKFNNFELAGFHDLVTLTGSLILGLAATRQTLPVTELWSISRIDEHWQVEQWGEDEEAISMEKAKLKSFFVAHDFFHMAKKTHDIL